MVLHKMTSAPGVVYRGGVCMLGYGDIGLRFTFSHFYEDRYGLRAELKLENLWPKRKPRTLDINRFLLTSSTDRNRTAKHLGDTYRGDMWVECLWPELVEEACQLTLEKHREGNDVVTMAHYVPGEALGWRLEPFLREKQSTVLFGDGDVGKSYLAMFWGLLVASGKPAADLSPEPGNVLYLDWENTEDDTFDRLAQLTEGLHCEIPEAFKYRKQNGLIANDIQRIAELVELHKINLVIVDHAGQACEELQNEGTVNAYFRALNSLGCTTLTLSHIAKTEGAKDPFGSKYWRNVPRANWRAYGAKEAGGSVLRTALKHTKGNNTGTYDDRAYRLDFSIPGVCTVTESNPRDVKEVADGQTWAQKLRQELAAGALKNSELATRLDTSPDTTRMTLKRHTDLFVQLPDQRWGLVQR